MQAAPSDNHSSFNTGSSTTTNSPNQGSTTQPPRPSPSGRFTNAQVSYFWETWENAFIDVAAAFGISIATTYIPEYRERVFGDPNLAQLPPLASRSIQLAPMAIPAIYLVATRKTLIPTFFITSFVYLIAKNAVNSKPEGGVFSPGFSYFQRSAPAHDIENYNFYLYLLMTLMFSMVAISLNACRQLYRRVTQN